MTKRAVRTVHVDERNVGTRKDHALGHDESQASGTARHHSHAVDEGEAGECGLHELPTGAHDRLAGWQLMLGGMLDFNFGISTSPIAGLVVARRHVVNGSRGGEGRSQSDSDSLPRGLAQQGCYDAMSTHHDDCGIVCKRNDR